MPNSTFHPVSLTYSGNASLEGRELSLSLSWVKNVPGGTNGTTADFNLPGGRQGADANYQLWRYQFAGMQQLPSDWMLRGSFQGQSTRYALISGEQFGVGGMDSVRGFNDRSVANDYGTRASIELHSPDLGNLLNKPDIRMRALVFYDTAYLQRNLALPSEVKSQQISSFGFGLRSIYSKSINLRLDFAVVDKGAG
ncbi:MAG: ShlB/FhaC/HecB family hemolysin secretion/activation protein [Betaproteobacteria bacterium]